MRTLFWLVIPLTMIGCVFDASSEEKAPVTARFECETRIDEATGSPFSEAYLLVGEQKIKIADIGACDPLAPADYASYQIPDSALAACGGWWAGAGDYLYLIRQENTLVVLQGWQEEGQTGESFHYEEVYRVKVD